MGDLQFRGFKRNALLAGTFILLLGVLLPVTLVIAEGVNFSYLPLLQRETSNYYVSPEGDDANPGTIDAPWEHVQFAVEKAPPGSAIYLRTGTYLPITIEEARLSLIGYPGETAIFQGDGKEQHTIMIRDTSEISLSNLTIQNNPVNYGTGVHVENSQDISISNCLIQSNQGFGVVLKDVADVIVQNNELTDNANAIEVRYGSQNVMLRENLIHHNNRRLDSGRSAIGINFYYTTGPVTAQGNWLWENHTPELPDPGGAAIEVYGAANITITDNVFWDNETIMETGTDEDKTPCTNITFTRNLAMRGDRQQGLILRCAANSLVAHNTFDGLDNFVFNLSHYKGEYGASIEGLEIVNNIAVNGRVYVIETEMPASVVIDYNLAYNPGSSSDYGEYLAYVEEYGNTEHFELFQEWTGYEAHGMNCEPQFLDPANGDYHLSASSPAIDHGIPLGEPYQGNAPDLGRYEYTVLKYQAK